MKKNYGIKLMLSIVLFFWLAVSSFTTEAFATTKRKENITELVSQMERFENKMLSEFQQKGHYIGYSQKIKLNSSRKVEAAFLAKSTEVVEYSSIYDDDIIYTERVVKSAKSLKKTEINLFGTANGIKNLKTYPSKNIIENKIYKRNGNAIMQYSGAYSDEVAYDINRLKITKNKVYKDVYYGYWGWADGEFSNYRITYNIEKDESSKYGYIITSMKIKKIAGESRRETDICYYDSLVSACNLVLVNNDVMNEITKNSYEVVLDSSETTIRKNGSAVNEYNILAKAIANVLGSNFLSTSAETGEIYIITITREGKVIRTKSP